ncbi:MAG: hypothetical protein ACKPKO_06435, partial [Candidatus Fonsibacter sp.]
EEATGTPPPWGPAYKEFLNLFGDETEEDRQAASHLLKRLEEWKPTVVGYGGYVVDQQRTGDAGASQRTAADTGESSGALAAAAPATPRGVPDATHAELRM